MGHSLIQVPEAQLPGDPPGILELLLGERPVDLIVAAPSHHPRRVVPERVAGDEGMT